MNITLGDKEFRPYIAAADIDKAVEDLANQINRDYAGKNPLIVAVLNGSFMFCADFARKLTCNPEFQFVKLSSYEGTSTTGRVVESFGLPEDMRNRHVIVLEDIVDTGLTTRGLFQSLKSKRTASAEIVTLFFKSEAFISAVQPKYYGIDLPNDFVVGYGMDYKGMGRELSELYVLNS
jgi:hypoxanthine phosphoribosyltransferase